MNAQEPTTGSRTSLSNSCCSQRGAYGRPRLHTDFRRRGRLQTEVLASCSSNRYALKPAFVDSRALCSCLVSLAVSLSCCGVSWAEQYSRDTSNNIPSSLSSVGEQEQGVAGLGKLLHGEHGKEIQGCTRKCMPACLRGGEGAPGLGPITLRREVVIFKEGFRDRKYCLTECTTVCALSYNGGPGAEATAAEAKP